MGLSFEILGPVRVRRDGQTLRCRPAGPQPFWSPSCSRPAWRSRSTGCARSCGARRPPASAVANLRSHASQLRHLLDSPDELPRLPAEHGGYLLRVEPGELDATEFERLATDGHAARISGEHELATTLLSRALALWSPTEPPPAYGPATAVAFDRLRERRAGALETYAACRLDLGDPGTPQLLTLLRQHLAEHPLREPAWALLMTALHRAGDHSGVVQTYQAACRALDGELGVAPGPELTELYRSVRRQERRTAIPTRRPGGTPPRHRAVALRVPHELPCPARRSSAAGQSWPGCARRWATPGGNRSPWPSTAWRAPASRHLALRAAAAALDAFPDGQLHLDLGGSVADAHRLPFSQIDHPWRPGPCTRAPTNRSRPPSPRCAPCLGPCCSTDGCCWCSTMPPTPPRSSACCRSAAGARCWSPAATRSPPATPPAYALYSPPASDALAMLRATAGHPLGGRGAGGGLGGGPPLRAAAARVAHRRRSADRGTALVADPVGAVAARRAVPARRDRSWAPAQRQGTTGLGRPRRSSSGSAEPTPGQSPPNWPPC